MKDDIERDGINQAESARDLLTEMIRQGAKDILRAALENEIAEYLAQFSCVKLEGTGKKRFIRNGYHSERKMLTGIGEVSVRVPRSRDMKEGSNIVFESKIVPKYLRKTKNVEELIPWLYLKGVSTGDFAGFFEKLTGQRTGGISEGVVSRLKKEWEGEHAAFKTRSLAGKEYVYVWADGIYTNVRMDSRQCLLVLIGATKEGKKELIAVEGGFRESEESWSEMLISLRNRGLKIPPKLATGDGALGFWKALSKIYPDTEHQRCWVHKTANVLAKLPKKLQPQAKKSIHEIYMAPTKKDGEKAFDKFAEVYGAKYPKAVACLMKDRERMMKFYDFPAEHWQHVRTTNPIESTFATVRLRTDKVRGCFSARTVEAMGFKLCGEAEKNWRRLKGHQKLDGVSKGDVYMDGELKMAA